MAGGLGRDARPIGRSVGPLWISIVAGRGGQFIYRLSEGFQGRTSTDKDHLRPDFLRGGLAIVPPSIHPSGMSYKWVKGHSPFDIPLSDLPMLPAFLETYWLSFCQPKGLDRPLYHVSTPNCLARRIWSALAEELACLRPGADDNWTGRCPFHEDRNPSFSINFDKGVWCCFSGCGQGTIRQLAERLDRLNVPRVTRVRGGHLKVRVSL